jgi:hypothetical protein
MKKSFILPSKENKVLWLNALFLLVLVLTKNADPLVIVLAYFLETIFIGILHVIKLHLVIKYGKKDTYKKGEIKPGLGLILFFIFHYGFFIAVQLVFVFVFFGIINPTFSNSNFILESTGLAIVLISIIVTNVYYFYNNFLVPKKYIEYSPQAIFFKPYARIIVQQFVVILSGFFFIIFPTGTVTAILIIIFRFITDSFMVFIKKDSEKFDSFVKEKANSYDHYLELKKKYQEFSE